MTTMIERPWYMSAALTLFGWLGALLFLIAAGLFFDVLNLLENGRGPLIFGVAILALLLWVERRLSNAYIQETVAPLMMGACLSIIFGIFAFLDINAATLCCWALLIVFSTVKPRAMLAFTLTIAAWFFTFAALGETTGSIVEESLVSIVLIISVILSLFPNIYFRATEHGLATLLALTFLLSFDVFDFRMTEDAALLKGPAAAVFATILWLLNDKRVDLKFIAIVASALIAFTALPPAVLPASGLMLIGWIRGDRAFSIIGLLLTVAVVFQYYTSLDLSLVERSLHFSVIGFALLIIYGILKR